MTDLNEKNMLCSVYYFLSFLKQTNWILWDQNYHRNKKLSQFNQTRMDFSKGKSEHAKHNKTYLFICDERHNNNLMRNQIKSLGSYKRISYKFHQILWTKSKISDLVWFAFCFLFIFYSFSYSINSSYTSSSPRQFKILNIFFPFFNFLLPVKPFM